MSYKLEVIADSSGTWASNALVFATADEALAYGINLRSRWYLVREIRATEVPEPANYAFTAGQTVPL